jgi:hypothetical protein
MEPDAAEQAAAHAAAAAGAAGYGGLPPNIEAAFHQMRVMYDGANAAATRPAEDVFYKNYKLQTYDGSYDPISWLFNMDRFFHIAGIQDPRRVELASLQLVGNTTT